MYCIKCGQNNPKGNRFCTSCGAPLLQEEPRNTESSYEEPVWQEDTFDAAEGEPVPDDYRPITAWGYFGWSLLFMIPIAGLVLLIVFSVGGTKNVNLRNYARSYFCGLLVAAIIFAVLIIVGLILGHDIWRYLRWIHFVGRFQ